MNVKVSKQKFERDLKDKAYDTIDKDWSETNTLVRCLTLAIVDLEHYNKVKSNAQLHHLHVPRLLFQLSCKSAFCSKLDPGSI